MFRGKEWRSPETRFEERVLRGWGRVVQRVLERGVVGGGMVGCMPRDRTNVRGVSRTVYHVQVLK